MKNLLAITVAGQTKWLEEAISTLQDDLYILVVDDSTERIEEFCKQKKVKFATKAKPKGLTDSWNMAYQYFMANDYDNCILSNDDVRFPSGFSEGLLKGLEKFDLIAPLTNEPGNIWDSAHSPTHQEIRRYIDIEPNKNNIDKVQKILSERYRNGQFRQCNFINGFCFAFSRSISKFAFDKQYLFNPARVNTWNEYDLAERISNLGGKIGICKTSYVFHWKGKTTEKLDKNWGPGDYREQLWR